MVGVTVLLALWIWPGAAVAADALLFTDCPDCPDMIALPRGRFLMGAADQRPEFGPAVDVAIVRAFALSVTEVTFDQYQRCVDGGGCAATPDDHGWGRGRRPVINVSWDDANRYATWLSRRTSHAYRLPSESEWEYAARGGAMTAYAWGELVGSGRANCRGCGASPWDGTSTAPAASFAANGFGFHDMAGNVSEWVADCWFDRHDPAASGQAARGSTEGACRQRVTRGGDWYYIAPLATSAARMKNAPIAASYTIGFRVARDIDGSETAKPEN
jgi:formylglycine-generating enzyme required for sulfatase activity